MKRILAVLIFISISSVGFGQYLIQSKGEIPSDFLVSSTVKYKEDIEKIRNENSKDKKDKNQFYLESNFTIDNILQSGYVVFNDEISSYLNDVLDQIPLPKSNKKKARVYVLNSDEVNAFATAQGIIFVSVGLVARVENEAQLAFILSHELAHVQHDHSINKFIINKKIEGDKDEVTTNDLGFDTKLFKKSLFSQDLEREADEKGMKYFAKSDYSVSGVEGIFDILHYSFLPYSDKPFERTFFEDEYFKFSEGRWLTAIDSIPEMTESDELSSHPSALSRKKWLSKEIEDGEKGKSKFVVSEERFTKIKELAQYQLPYIALKNYSYSNAIYNAYTLLDRYPEDVELRKVIAYSLYCRAMINAPKVNYSYTMEDSDSEKEEDEEDEEITYYPRGEAQRVDHFFENLDKGEFLILAARYAYQIQQQFKGDELIDIMVSDLFRKLNKRYDGYDGFVEDGDTLYWAKAFKAFDSEKDFISIFDNGKDRPEVNTKRTNGNRISKNNVVERLEEGEKLGVDKIVLVNPFYLSIDGGDESIQFIRSEEKQLSFIDKIEKVKRHTDLEIEVLDVDKLTSKNVENFNDIIQIENYIKQKLAFSDQDELPIFNQEVVNRLSEKYDTDYFLWTGVITLKNSRRKTRQMLQSIVFPYYFPSRIPYLFGSNYDMLYYSILFDVNSGKKAEVSMNYFQHKDYDSMIKAHLYDTFNKIYAD